MDFFRKCSKFHWSIPLKHMFLMLMIEKRKTLINPIFHPLDRFYISGAVFARAWFLDNGLLLFLASYDKGYIIFFGLNFFFFIRNLCRKSLGQIWHFGHNFYKTGRHFHIFHFLKTQNWQKNEADNESPAAQEYVKQYSQTILRSLHEF